MEGKLKKGKITLTISIGCTAFILFFVMFTQIKTVQETDITGIEIMRETELRAELASWKGKYNEVSSKVEETQNKINEYTNQINNNDDVSLLLNDELNEAYMYAGLSDVYGQGITITLSDNEFRNIDEIDLILLVNELRAAGAEAISINSERVLYRTEIVGVGYKYILVNGTRIQGPYVVKAIGDKKYLESSISIKNGYIDEMKADNKSIEYTVEDNIVIPKYSASLDFEHAKNVEN